MLQGIYTKSWPLAELYPGQVDAILNDPDYRDLGLHKDDLALVRKGFVSKQLEVDAKKRTIVHWISKEETDRDGERLTAAGMRDKHFRDNPVVSFAHKYNELAIAKSLWRKIEPEIGVKAKTMFWDDPFALRVWRAYGEPMEGTGEPLMKAWSVGFVGIKWRDFDVKEVDVSNPKAKPKRQYDIWETLEYGAVLIPSCAGALSITTKGVKAAMADYPVALQKATEDFLREFGFLDDEEFVVLLLEAEEGMKERKGAATLASVRVTVDTKLLQEALKLMPAQGNMTIENLNSFVQEIGELQGILDEKIMMGEEEVKEAELVLKPETTDNYHMVPAPGEEGKHRGHAIRWITLSKEKKIKALYCVDCKKIISYAFDRSAWTMDEAKQWVKNRHGKAMEEIVEQRLWEPVADPEAGLKPYPNEHACRLKEPHLFQPRSFRRVSRESDGKRYDIIMGRLEGETVMTEQAYRYPKDVWSVDQAKAHCKVHKGIRFEPAKTEGKEMENLECKECRQADERGDGKTNVGGPTKVPTLEELKEQGLVEVLEDGVIRWKDPPGLKEVLERLQQLQEELNDKRAFPKTLRDQMREVASGMKGLAERLFDLSGAEQGNEPPAKQAPDADDTYVILAESGEDPLEAVKRVMGREVKDLFDHKRGKVVYE